MTPQELKNSILQLAVQGRLVEQRPEEGTAAELYQQIRAKKQQFIKAGKLKKEKPLPEITEEEKPFEILENWMWVRVADLGSFSCGYAFKSRDYIDEKGIQVVRISDLAEDEISTKNAVYYPEKEELKPYLIKQNSFLICLTGSIGKMAWIKDSSPRYLNQRVGMYIPTTACEILYLWHFFHTDYVLNQWISAKKSTNGNIKNSTVTDLYLPLPPLAEQKRIVAKIEELLPYIDRYGQAWSRLDALNKRFPDEIQKSILQLAVQGKLVEQRPEEGTAAELYQQIRAKKQQLIKTGKLKKEKTLPEITEEEKPFDIPESWMWVRLGSLCSYIQRGKSPKYSAIKKYPVISQKCNQWLGFSIEKAQFIEPDTLTSYARERLLQDYDLLLNSTGLGTLGRIAVYREFLNPYGLAVVDSHVTVIRTVSSCVCSLFLYYYFANPSVQSVIEEQADGSTKQKELSLTTVKEYLIPLPPFAEQKRIVAKIEELLGACEKLKRAILR